MKRTLIVKVKTGFYWEDIVWYDLDELIAQGEVWTENRSLGPEGGRPIILKIEEEKE